MKIDVGIGEATIRNVEGVVGHEQFSNDECFELADMLENLNTPDNGGAAIRRLTDLLWALQNDTSVMILSNPAAETSA
jgi:hypothetical protein